MRALSNVDYLDLWERGFGLHPLNRGLLVLGAVFPDEPHGSLADWPLGRRNSALAETHGACFGPNLQGQISCPQCTVQLEFQMDVRRFISENPNPTIAIVVKGHSFRLPTSRDLARTAHENNLRVAAIQVAETCRIEPREKIDWRDEELEEIGEAMASADPMAEIRLAFVCTECGHRWDEALDIAAFLWAEIEARAKRLLMEVHALASAYGWNEKEILLLSEPRRRLYLEMAQR
jgi:hypothetical protein